MRFRIALSLATLVVVCFTVVSRATPVSEWLVPEKSFPSPDNPSPSGKIASIADAAFSLDVPNGQERKTMEFLVDDDTKVEAPWSIALQGRNIAVHVVVKRASGFKGW